jgi:hypothetical protein
MPAGPSSARSTRQNGMGQHAVDPLGYQPCGRRNPSHLSRSPWSRLPSLNSAKLVDVVDVGKQQEDRPVLRGQCRTKRFLGHCLQQVKINTVVDIPRFDQLFFHKAPRTMHPSPDKYSTTAMRHDYPEFPWTRIALSTASPGGWFGRHSSQIQPLSSLFVRQGSI